MYATNFHAATSVGDALAKLSAAEDGRILAGGQTLIPTMKQRLAAPLGGYDVDDHQKIGGLLFGDNAVTDHVIRKLRICDGNPILDVDCGNVGIGSNGEGDSQGITAVIATCR